MREELLVTDLQLGGDLAVAVLFRGSVREAAVRDKVKINV